MESTAFVYVLYDCADFSHIRYVGKTKHPSRRFVEHINEARTSHAQKHTYKNRWIRSLEPIEQHLKFSVVEAYSCEEDAYAAEIWWIAHLRSTGHRLVNASGGGEGFTAEDSARAGHATAMKIKTDPEFAKRHSETGRKFGVIGGQRLQQARSVDVELDQRLRETASIGGKCGMAALHQRINTDAAFREKVRAAQRSAGQKSEATRVKCCDCGYISSHPSMGYHFRKTGHTEKVVL